MRKIFAVICSLMLAVSLVLSGCGQKGSNAAAPAGSSVNAAGIASVPAYSGNRLHHIKMNGCNFHIITSGYLLTDVCILV